MAESRRRPGVGTLAELRAAHRLKADLMPASGSMAGAKGDMRIEGVLIESKSTESDSLRLDYGWLNKIHAEAREKGLTPALLLQFVVGSGHPRRNGAWVCMPEADFQELVASLRRTENP